MRKYHARKRRRESDWENSARLLIRKTYRQRDQSGREGENVTVALAKAVHLLSAKCRRIELSQMNL